MVSSYNNREATRIAGANANKKNIFFNMCTYINVDPSNTY